MVRLASLLVVLSIAAATFAAASYAVDVVYAGPKTWLPGWDAESYYDSAASNRWWWDEMDRKSCGGAPDCFARVTFIKTDGSWSYSRTDTYVATYTTPPVGADNYTKKPYCKNNSSRTYTARCWGSHY
jgi:hypothetical protein